MNLAIKYANTVAGENVTPVFKKQQQQTKQNSTTTSKPKTHHLVFCENKTSDS